MSAAIMVLLVASENHLMDLAVHIRGLQADGQRVLYVTADRPYGTVQQVLADAGVVADEVQFIDCVTCMDGHPPPVRSDNALFLQSPTMLEMIAMRVEQVVARLHPTPVVIVDSLSTLSLYNGVPPVQEFSHYLANRLRTHGATGHFVVRDNAAGQALHDRVRGFTDGTQRLGVTA